MFDLLLENMEVTSLIKADADLDDVLDLLEKGLGHKYLRRIPTGQPGHPYRYVYSATHALTGSAPAVGEKVRLDDDENEGGHYEITKLHPNDHVTMKHDVTGREMTVHKNTLRDMMKEQHGGAIEARNKALIKVHEQALKTGTPRQQERASAALNAHNMAFNADKYGANKKYADTLSQRVLNDKFTTTHQHHEAMGAHVVAANQAPSHEAREHHMAQVQKLSGSLDALKQKIAGQNAARDAADKPRQEQHAATVANETPKADINKPEEPAASKPADKIKEGVAAMAPAATGNHEERTATFRKHLMGEGSRSPRALQRYDNKTNELKQKRVGDKETLEGEDVKHAAASIKDMLALAKEKGGRGKASAALREARDHWRYMAGLHGGRSTSSRGTQEDTKNMYQARRVREALNAAMAQVRGGGKPAGVVSDTTASKAAVGGHDAKRASANKKAGSTDSRQRGANDKGPLGAPDTRGKGGESFFEGLDKDKNEATGASSTHLEFNPDEHKNLPKGATLKVHAPHAPGVSAAGRGTATSGDDSNEDIGIHTFQHLGHGELKPIGRSSKNVNTLADLKGHDVRVSEPGDTRTGDMFAGKRHGNEGETESQMQARVHNAALKSFTLEVDSLDALIKGAGVKDEATWKRATKEALKTYEKSHPKFYAVVATIYQGMGGTYSRKAQKGAMMDDMKKADDDEPARSHIIKGRGVLMPQLKLGEPFAENRPRMRAPVEDLVYFGAAPAVHGPNQGVVRSMAAARAKKEVEAAILGAYRTELMKLEAGNPFLQTVTKHSTGYHRPSVPAQMVKSLNVGTPDSGVVVDKAVARLKVRAREDAQVRQGLALMKLSKADVFAVFVGMGLTPERVYAGQV